MPAGLESGWTRERLGKLGAYTVTRARPDQVGYATRKSEHRRRTDVGCEEGPDTHTWRSRPRFTGPSRLLLFWAGLSLSPFTCAVEEQQEQRCSSTAADCHFSDEKENEKKLPTATPTPQPWRTDLVVGIFFLFLTLFKLFSNMTLFFFKTNTFSRAYCHGTAKCLCRAMHGGVAGG